MINGQPYNVKIVAVYANGEESLPSLVSTATPGTALAPSGLTSVGGNQKLTVSFTPPAATGGFDVTNYSYDVWPASDTSHVENWQALSTPKVTSPIVIPGLTNGTAYKFKLRAENASGAGQISAQAQGTTKPEVPSAPTITSVSAGNASLTVAFDAPATDGGKPITSYKYSINNGVTKLAYEDTLSPIDIENLTNGTKYAVILYAVNEVGIGAPSEAVEGLPSEGATPSAPKITNVISGIRQLSVVFTPPVKDNGSAITRYQYKLNSGRWTTRKPETDLTSPIVITGLANNTSYKVQIRAVNASGAGAASAVALKSTPKVVPSHPKILLIDFIHSLPAYGRPAAHFDITFTPPDDGGSPITSYRLSVDDEFSGAIPIVDENAFHNPQEDLRYFRAALVPPPSPQGTRIGYLKVFDTAYNMFEILFGQTWFPLIPIKIQAENALGLSEWSPIEVFTQDPEGPPLDAPTNVTITVLDSTSIRIDFTPPTRTLTQPIVGYQYSLNDGLTYSVTVEALNNTITVTDLLPGSAYDVKIKGVNNQDFAAASTTVRVITAPEAPTAPTIYAIVGLENTLVVQFSTPVVPGGVILDYEYSLNEGSFVPSGVRSSPITLTGTDNDVLYTVAVRAVNQVGPGAVSNTASGISGSPSAPVITAVKVGTGRLGTGGELKVYFNPPISDGGSNIIKYHYSIDNGATYTSILNTTTYTTSISPIVISSLVNGDAYQIMLKAENARSIGQPSQVVSGTPYTTPLEPVLTQVIVDTSKLGTATLYFTPPTSDGGSSIISYDYTLDNGNAWQNSVSAVSDNFIVLSTSKANSTEIQVLVRAVNAAGAGKLSNRISAKPITVPSYPTAVELVQVPENPKNLILRFNPPESNGGSAITHYAYTVYGLPPNEFYIPVSQLSTPLPYTFQLPNTFSYGNTATVSISAVNFGANTETPITATSGVSARSFASIYVVPYTLTMPTIDWVQLGTIQYAPTRELFVQPITLKLPCDPSNTYIGKSIEFMQSLVTRVDYDVVGPGLHGSGRVFEIDNIGSDSAQRTSFDAPGSFTFTPDPANMLWLRPDGIDFSRDYTFTFTASNKHWSSPPYTVKTRYTAPPRPQLVTAPAPDAVKPAEYRGFEVINISPPLIFNQLLAKGGNGKPFAGGFMSIVEIYVDLENTDMVYSLYIRPKGAEESAGYVSEVTTLPIAKDFNRLGGRVNGNQILGYGNDPVLTYIQQNTKPSLYEVWRRTLAPNYEISHTSGNDIVPAGLPFEGEALAGGKQMLSLKILRFLPGDEVKLTLAAKNSAGVTHPSRTIVLNTNYYDAPSTPYTMQPAWWACMSPPLPPQQAYMYECRTPRGYLTVVDPAVEQFQFPLTISYHIKQLLYGQNYPTYLIGGGFARWTIPACIEAYPAGYNNSGLVPPHLLIIVYDIEIYRLPEKVFLGWRYRGENDIMWRWFTQFDFTVGWEGVDIKNLMDYALNHCPYSMTQLDRTTPNFPDVFKHESFYFPDYLGNNRALLRMTVFEDMWAKLNTLEGAMDPRQLEFITCTKIEGPLGIPAGDIGQIVPYYLNTSNPCVTECYASPPLSSGRVSVEVPKINYNFDGPCEPYARDGYWTPTPFQQPTTAQINAFKARYPKYFATDSSEGGGGAGGPGGN